MEKLTVVKVGGKVVEEPQSLSTLIRLFTAIQGNKILVHGGGRSATDIAAKMGIESQYVDGRRITDAATLEVVTMVYGGLVNKNIVAQLQALGQNALGLSGADLNVIQAVKRPVKSIDYGFVGDVTKVNGEVLHQLLQLGTIPVMAPLTHNGEGLMLNTNADTIAAETAKAMSKYCKVQLVYCFEKPGVLENEQDDESVIAHLNQQNYREYVQKGVISGGMIPKLDNAFDAIAAGVNEVVITKFENLSTNSGTSIR